jgi:hypothetical protein
MIAANLDNLLFLLLIIVAGLFQFLAKVLAKKGKDPIEPASPTQTPASSRRAPSNSGDQIRKLLEALGQPPTSVPPPPVAPRTNIPARPLSPVQPPPSPLSQFRREKRRKRDATTGEAPPSPLTVKEAQKIPVPKITAPPVFEVQKGPLPIAASSTSKMPAQPYAAQMPRVAMADERRVNIAVLLASSSSLRDAVILREILGPPRGLREMDALL